MKKFVTTLIALGILSALPLSACNKRGEEHTCTWRTVREPDCTTAGLRERTCDCGKTGDEEIPALGHSWVDDRDDDDHWQKCTRTGCGEERNREAHTFGADDKCGCGYTATFTRNLEYAEVYAADETTVIGYAVAGLKEGATDTAIKIPATYEGKPVTAIAQSAFYIEGDGSPIESVTVPDSVKTIGDYAFYNCAKLKTVKLGNGIEAIGNYAFYATDITAIETPASVKTIGNYVFWKCNSLVTAKIAGAQTIGAGMFFEDAALESVEFGENVTAQFAVKSYVLYNCPSLKTLKINGNVKFEKYSLYNVAEASVDVIFGDNLTEIQANALYPEEWSSTFGSAIKSIKIGKNVKKIGEYAFDMCDNVKSLVLPEGLEEICTGALSMDGVEELTVPKSVKYLRIGSCGMVACKRVNYGGTIDDWLKIKIEGNTLANPLGYGADLYVNGEKVTDVVIDGVAEVPARQFAGATFTSVTFGESVKEVGQDAFLIARNAESQLDSTIMKVVILSKEFKAAASWGSINGDCEIYYKGTPEEMLANVIVSAGNVHWFKSRVHYFYSETGTEAAYDGASGWTYGGLWHYENGQVTKW